MSESPLAIAADHPAYHGHFPGRPILPAVVLVAEALARIERDTGHPPEHWTLANAKFPMPVAPGAALSMSHEASGTGVHFEIRGPGGVVASGKLSARP